MKERLLQIADFYNLSVRQLELKCGMSNGYIKNIVNGLGRKKLDMVLSAFPEINREWLVLGTGEMLKQTSVTAENAENKPSLPDNNIQHIINENEQLKKQVEEQKAQIASLTKILENISAR